MYENIYDFLSNIYTLLLAGLVFFILYKYDKKRIFDLAVAIIAAIASAASIKYWINKPRPEPGIELFEGSSFPSSHTTVAFTVLFFYLLACHSLSLKSHGRGDGKKQGIFSKLEMEVLALFLTFLAVMVGINRVLADAHFAMDVFAGIILGFLISLPFIFYDVSLKRLK